MKLTRKMIDDGKSDRGAWSARQLAMLGVPWPPLRGWPERIIGTEISEAVYAEFLAIRKRSKGAILGDDIRAGTNGRLPHQQKDIDRTFTGDRNVESVKPKMDARAKLGFAKYGVTTERTDFSLLDWLRHAQEESMDQVIYLEAAIRKEEARIAEGAEPTAEAFANALFDSTGGKLA